MRISKLAPIGLTAIIVLTPLTQAVAVNVIVDDFTTSTVSSNARFRLNQADAGWFANASSEWAVASNMLMNAGTATGVPAEGAVGQLVSVSGVSSSVVTVAFDYEVGAGSTLYFHLTGFTENGSPAASESLANTGAQNGNIQNQADAQFGDMSILTGNDPGNGTGDAINFPGASSGTYSATFDLSNYSWAADEAPGLSGALTNITDFDFIHAAFGVNENDTGLAGGVAIKNFSVTVPEPGSLPLIGFLTVSFLAFGRRQRSA